MELEIREIAACELEQLVELYGHLKTEEKAAPETYRAVFEKIKADSSHYLLGGFIGDELISSVVLVVIPNLTRQCRSYGVIENVVTLPQFRGRGYATALLDYAADIAREQNCYKLMLMTGSKLESTLDFYERAGFNKNDKTAFIRWL